ncbi:response regulator transcription factor [Azospirillum sp. SYSU D00513]|uniref:response regulator transcription factor n=1 Tax=Azospirillum sp. SYSU D00513 TaxID=2812561 RepID=UPI001A9779D7|nr:response regulator transcription factor [Azospirillum sp. SYSU D00513]
MTLAKRILLVDDDEALRQSLAEQLQLQEEFETVEAGTGADGLDAARAASSGMGGGMGGGTGGGTGAGTGVGRPFDAVLLDVGLPDMDGRELCRLMRREGVRCPIIMLTAAGTDADTILGLDSGANDYITKPFRLGVLLARLRAQLRQFEQSEDAVLSIGPYSFRTAGKLLLDEAGKRKIRLTEKETAILKHLYRAGETAVGRDTLLGEVWGYNAAVTTHTLETHIYRLRQKIERDPSNAQILVTVPGGYRLVP